MKLKLLIAFILLAGVASAQTNLVSYEYWFNNDYANVQTTTFSPATQHVLNTNIDISALPNNLNVLNIRYKDENGKYSSTLSKLFVKMPDMGTPGVNNLVSYEYWFNNDYANVQTTSFSPAPQHVLNTNIDISALPNNLNVLNIRYKDENGKYSSTLSKLFVKIPDMGTPGVNNLVSYEYWFNNDYANVQTTTFSPATQHVLNTNIDISALPNNLNVLNIRYKDENGKYSSTLSKLFVKMPNSQIIDNKLTDYMYWFDDDFSNATTVTLPQNMQAHNWVELLPLPSNMEGGTHEINIRFKDSFNMWSVPFTKTFTKGYAPRAEFNGMESEFCYGTMLQITPEAIDVDSIYWNYGDGTPIEVKDDTTPIQHFYVSSGTYTLTATMKHVASGISVDTTFIINVYPAYGITDTIDNSIAVSISVCETELPYSFGTQSLTTTGNYTETFQTTHGCDSTVNLNFTVLQTSYGTDVQTACKSFTWIDGNTYTTSNNTATYTLAGQAANGCDSIVTLDLTINNVDVSVTQNAITLVANAIGAEYLWLDCNNNYSPIDGAISQIFTATQNGSYAVAVTQNGCTDTSDCYVITSVGLLENSFDSNIIVYPNPTDGLVTVQLGNMHSIFSVAITDMGGKEIVKSIYNNTDNFELNLNAQPGIYLMKIISGDKRAIIRLAIK